MSPREPIPARTPSRLRARPRVCALSVHVAAPRAMVACGEADGEPTVVAWSRALAHPVALTRARRVAVSPWDLAAPARCLTVAELMTWARPVTVSRAVTYTGRKHAEAPPLRQAGVAGDLAAALATIDDVPQWVDPAAVLARVRAVVETPGTTRAQMLATMGRAGA